MSAAQLSAAQALMVMREGEPTAAMAFLKSKRAGANPDATGWVEVESDPHAWWISADEDTQKKAYADSWHEQGIARRHLASAEIYR